MGNSKARLEIRRATPGQFQTVLDILDEAAAWLQDRGIEQWPAQFGGLENWRTERLRAYVNAGETYLVYENDQAVATITVTLKADPDYAEGWPHGPDTGVYIHRMAVRRTHAGRGIGKQLIDWANTLAARTGRSWLRLDCSRTNTHLQRYYEDQGFVRVGEVIADIDPRGSHHTGQTYRRGSGALYQRPIHAMDDMTRLK